MQPGGFARPKQFFAFAVKNHIRLARFAPAHFNIMPADRRPNPRPERFGNRFLGRKSRRNEWRWIAMRQAVFHLSTNQNTQREALAEFLERRSNPLHFDQIDARSEDQCAG